MQEAKEGLEASCHHVVQTYTLVLPSLEAQHLYFLQFLVTLCFRLRKGLTTLG